MVQIKQDTGTVVRRGLAIYESEVAPQLSDDDNGCYVAIDVNTGEWEIDDTPDATEILCARVPDAEIFLWRHPEVARGFVRAFPPGMMKRLGIPCGIVDEALE